ncbi:extracellular solute-binding protein [Rubritalea profundi]|uniref:Fe(3+) ABC transporter substrate-binding protein n=1 Tax=Rubritalea profundi TaxID=1658618 RepID=A0A2S7U751_9BACT|nr:extracellular solute-binding protein [Rubritalea profundi]PQJ30033.1 Fe(3+) ABC transporter substrate-binding protein [Rubritalea profundi]
MKNNIISIGLLAISSLSALANEVTLYTYRHYEADSALYEKFTQKTGIKVNIVKSKADALFERLKSEGSDCKSDLLVTSDAARLVKAKNLGLLQSVESSTLFTNVPANLRDEDNQWFGITVRARVIVYNKDKVKAGAITSYEDLTKPEWKGRVVARSSSNIYNQSLLASMVANKGSKEALLWALKLRKNMARKPQGSDRDQMRAVAAGLADAAIVNTYYIGLLANSQNTKDQEVASKIAVCFPNQDSTGTHINISGAGICKYSPNKANALKLLEFLTSVEAQSTFPKTTSEFPLSMKSDSPLILAWGKFKADNLKLSELGKHNATAAKLFNAANWE